MSLRKSSRLVSTLSCVLLLGGTANADDALAGLRQEVSRLVGERRLPADSVELFVSGPTIASLLGKFEDAPGKGITIRAVSTNIVGQIYPGRRNYLEFHGNPSMHGTLVISEVKGRWSSDPAAVHVNAIVDARAEAGLKAMIASNGVHFGAKAKKTEQVHIAFIPSEAADTWINGSLEIRAPGRLAFTVEAPGYNLPVGVDVPVGRPLVPVLAREPLVFAGRLRPVSGGAERGWRVTIKPVRTGVNAHGIKAQGRVEVEIVR